MNLALQPIETLLATGFAGAIISWGQKGNGPAIVKRANTALAVVAAGNALLAGNSAQGVQLFSSALQSSDLDPGVATAIQGLFSIGAQQLGLIATVNGVTAAGQLAETVATNIAAGITAAANAEIAKYGTPASAAATPAATAAAPK
jgi:hypothetical protein